jgi:hypothetical protein
MRTGIRSSRESSSTIELDPQRSIRQFGPTAV